MKRKTAFLPLWVRIFIFTVLLSSLAYLGGEIGANRRANDRQERISNLEIRKNIQSQVAACQVVLYVQDYIERLRVVFETGTRANQDLVQDLIAVGDKVVSNKTLCDLAEHAAGHRIESPKPYKGEK